MLIGAGLEVSECSAVTMIANTFMSYGAMASNTLGEAVAVKMYSTAAWSLNGRFNKFKGNNAGVHIMSGAHGAHALTSKNFFTPTGNFRYNRFDTSAAFAFAIADLFKASTHEGALIANGNFNTKTAAGNSGVNYDV